MDKDTAQKVLETVDRKDMDPSRKLVIIQKMLTPEPGDPVVVKKPRRAKAKKEGEDA
jgi:hypothetical protein